MTLSAERGAHQKPAQCCSALFSQAFAQFARLRNRAHALSGIFRAIERRHVRRVAIEIRAPDPKLFFVRIDPLPQLLARGISLKSVVPFDAYEIGRKTAAVAAAATSAMI